MPLYLPEEQGPDFSGPACLGFSDIPVIKLSVKKDSGTICPAVHAFMMKYVMMKYPDAEWFIPHPFSVLRYNSEVHPDLE